MFALNELHRWAMHRLEQVGDFGLLLAVFVVVAVLVAFPRGRLWMRALGMVAFAAIMALRDRRRKVD